MGKWLTSRPARLKPGKEHRYPLNKRMGTLQGRSGRFWRREKSRNPTGIRTPDPADCSLVAIPSTQEGSKLFYSNGPQPLWLAGSRAANVTITVSGTQYRLNF